MDLTQLLISIVTGGVGGNVAGALFKQFSLGTVLNTVAGVVGGGIGSQILGGLLGGAAPTGLAGNIAGSGVGGILVMIIMGFVKNAMTAKSRS